MVMAVSPEILDTFEVIGKLSFNRVNLIYYTDEILRHNSPSRSDAALIIKSISRNLFGN